MIHTPTVYFVQRREIGTAVTLSIASFPATLLTTNLEAEVICLLSMVVDDRESSFCYLCFNKSPNLIFTQNGCSSNPVWELAGEAVWLGLN